MDVISDTDSEELYFLDVAEPKEPCGFLGALKEGCKITLGPNVDSFLKNISSFVTDGDTVNTGDKYGVWKFLQDYLWEHYLVLSMQVTYICYCIRKNLSTFIYSIFYLVIDLSSHGLLLKN